MGFTKKDRWAALTKKTALEVLDTVTFVRVKTGKRLPDGTLEEKANRCTLFSLALSNVKRALQERYPAGHELAGLMTPAAVNMTNRVLDRKWGKPKETKDININSTNLLVELDETNLRWMQMQKELANEESQRTGLDRGGDGAGGNGLSLAEGRSQGLAGDGGGEGPDAGTGDGIEPEPPEWDEQGDESGGTEGDGEAAE